MAEPIKITFLETCMEPKNYILHAYVDGVMGYLLAPPGDYD